MNPTTNCSNNSGKTPTSSISQESTANLENRNSGSSRESTSVELFTEKIPASLFGTIIGLSIASTFLPKAMARFDDMMDWPLSFTFRIFGLCFVGIPLLIVGGFAFKEFVFHNTRLSLRLFLLICAQLTPLLLFLLLTDGEYVQEIVLALTVAFSSFSYLIAFLPFIQLARNTKDSRKDRGTEEIEKKREAQRHNEEKSTYSRLAKELHYLAIVSGLSLAMLSLTYPWIGASRYSWILIYLAAQPSVMYLIFAIIENNSSSAERRSGLLLGNLLFLSIFWYPNLQISPILLSALSGFLILFSFAFHLATNRSITNNLPQHRLKHALRRTPKRHFRKLMKAAPGSLILLSATVWLAFIQGEKERNNRMGNYSTSLSEETYFHQMSIMDEPPRDGFYHLYLLPEIEAVQDLISEAKHINLLANQSISDEEKSPDKAEKSHSDHFLSNKILPLVDSTISMIRTKAHSKWKWAKGYLSVTKNYALQVDSLYTKYYPVNASDLREACFKPMEFALGYIDSIQKSERGGGSFLTLNEARKRSVVQLMTLSQNLSEFYKHPFNRPVNIMRTYEKMLKEFKGSTAIQKLGTLLTASPIKSGKKSIPLDTVFSRNEAIFNEADALLNGVYTQRQPQGKSREYEELLLLGLLVPMHEIDGLMYTALQPRSDQFVRWIENYQMYLKRFESYLITAPAEKARQFGGKAIANHMRTLILYHCIVLMLIAWVASRFHKSRSSSAFARGSGLVSALVFVIFLMTFDVGFDQLLDIQASKSVDSVTGWISNVVTIRTKESEETKAKYNDPEVQGEMLIELKHLREEIAAGNDLLEILEEYHIKKEEEL